MKIKNLKNNILMIISLISIVLIVLLALQENNISDLSFNNKTLQKLYGYSEPEGGVTYIEALGLEYISLGSIFNYGVTKDTILYYFENLMNQSLVEEGEDVLANVQNISLDEINSDKEEYLNLEDIASIEYLDYINNEGKTVDNNEIMSVLVPKTLSKENIETTSNAWKFNYHLYKDSFIGVKDAIWYSQLFETETVFNRAWTSLKWLCQDKIQCEILEDLDDKFNVFIYGSDGYNWYVSFERCNGDAFGFDKNINYISMNSVPLNEEDSLVLLSKYGFVSELESN